MVLMLDFNSPWNSLLERLAFQIPPLRGVRGMFLNLFKGGIL